MKMSSFRFIGFARIHPAGLPTQAAEDPKLQDLLKEGAQALLEETDRRHNAFWTNHSGQNGHRGRGCGWHRH